HLSVADRLRKGLRLVSETARARVLLSACTQVGPGARVVGRMRVENQGTVSIGNDFSVSSTFAPVELLAGPGGTVQMGNGVWLNFGTVIAAKQLVKIGDRVHMGPHCIVADVETPESILEPSATDAKPVELGDDVWLAGRVTVLPGVRIGDRAVISAGSI